MANNRMLLICGECFPEGRAPAHDSADASFAIAKYYPSSGWYTVRNNNRKMNEWLESHDHYGSEYNFRMEYEVV